MPIHPIEMGDNTQPSTASATIDLLLRLGEAADGERYRQAATRLLPRLSASLAQNPSAWGSLLSSLSAHRDVAATPETAPLDSAAHVQARAVGAVRVGYDEVRVTLDIAPGYHLNANPATLDYLIPTRLSFADIAPLQVDYPTAKSFATAFAHTALAVYAGQVAMLARLPRGALTKLATARVTIQACTDRICLPPATLEVPIQTGPDEPRQTAGARGQ